MNNDYNSGIDPEFERGEQLGYDIESEEKQKIIDALESDITHLKNLIVKMSYDIYYKDGSIMDTSIKKITKNK